VAAFTTVFDLGEKEHRRPRAYFEYNLAKFELARLAK